MGNCICKNACSCLSHQSEPGQVWLCCAELAQNLNNPNIRPLIFLEEDTKESFLESSSEGDDRRSSSTQSQASRKSGEVLQLGLPPDRRKIDQPMIEADIFGLEGKIDQTVIEADLFGLESISRTFNIELDPLCGCQKTVHQGKGCLHVIRKLRGRGDLLGLDRMKVSISRAHLRVYTVTWNMNGKKTALQDLSRLIGLVDGVHYDLFVVGLQEVPSYDVEGFLMEAFGDAYRLMASAVMMSLQLFVIGRKSLEGHFEDIRIDKVSGGRLAAVLRRQKGAVAVSLRFKETSFVFIASHLSPHEGNVEERNSQFQRISQTLFCSRTASPRLSLCLNASEDGGTAGYGFGDGIESLNTNAIEDSDLVVWLGDLNYRIQDHRSLVDALINQNLYKSLWHKDQLSREIQRGNVFKGFREAPLSFRPTYKYDVGTDNYDTSPKERVPSWTDRILYKVKESHKGINVDVCEYDAIDCIKSSDHRPVKAVFTLSPW